MSLEAISEEIRAHFTEKNGARDQALARSRELIRLCAESIRATHRREWEAAEGKLAAVRAAADALRGVVADYPDLYRAGYTQDGLKEVVEAFATAAIIRNQPLPAPGGRRRYLSQRAGRSCHRAAPLHPRHSAPRGWRR